MKLLILYEELAWYFINCINEFAASTGSKILVVYKSPAASAPFEFRFVHPHITLVERDHIGSQEIEEIVQEFNATNVFLGGWAHKPYLQLIKKLKFSKRAIGFDNQWRGSVRQILGAVFFRLVHKPYLDNAFVPGNKQVTFARMLGFKRKDITTGAYCCDYDLFNGAYQTFHEKKEKEFPRRFLFVGRYEKEKGIDLLWKAFIDLSASKGKDWELWCIGKGSLQAVEHPAIKHLGFLQPDELRSIIAETGIFVLPSTFEPWGVVVHEFAAAGFPMICTDEVGAASAFLEEGKNGFVIEPGNKLAIMCAMGKIMNMTDKELNLFAAHSVFLASQNTPKDWGRRLMEIYE